MYSLASFGCHSLARCVSEVSYLFFFLLTPTLQLAAKLYMMAIVREQVSIDNEKRRLSQLELDQRAEGVVRYVSRLHLAYDIAVCCLRQNRNLTS